MIFIFYQKYKYILMNSTLFIQDTFLVKYLIQP